MFSAVTDFAYAPRDAHVTVTGTGRFALPAAPAQRRLPARYGAAEDVPVELRGAGNASRQVNNFASVEAFECDALIAVEVLTPNGNWSSYPPHRHDDLEEIYYFEISGGGFGYQRVYDGIDVLQEVRSGDRIDLPRGYHGPSMAAARLRHVLPERDGRDRARVELRRRPRPRVDPRHVGRPGDRSAAADDVGEEARMRLTVAQALIRFLSVQYSERDGVEQRLIAGCFGIFGHGNVAGVGQALLEQPDEMPFYHARNEQAMVHTAAALRAPEEPALDAGVHELDRARARRTWSPARRWRRSTACRSCCCPATCSPPALPAPCCRSSRTRRPTRVSVNDTLRPVSKFWDRIERPEQLDPGAAGGDARAHRPGRDRRGHAGAAAGRAGRGVRLARGAVREARVARAPAGPGAGRARARPPSCSAARRSR